MSDRDEAQRRVTAPAEAAETREVAGAPSQRPPKIWQVIFIALVAIVFTTLFLAVNGFFQGIFWPSNFATTRRWTIPVGAVLFSLLVGLARKYLRAPSVIHGTALESLKGNGDEQIDYTTFPGALLTSFSSLLAGVSVGPEGPLGFLVQDIAAWFHERFKIARHSWLGFESAAFASMYNGIIGNPLFTGVLVTEYKVGGSAGLTYLAWNLLAGVIGYLFYTLLGLHTFAHYIAFTPISGITLLYALYAVLLAVVGVVVALVVALLFQLFERALDRVFKDGVVLRAAAVGAVTGVVCFFVPAVMFAGETQIFPMIQNPASYGVWALLGLGILKLIMFAMAFKGGFLGGPTFPILFACTMFGLAASLLFPAVPVAICVLSIEVAALTMASGAPLSMILLVGTVGTADTFTVALLALSSVVALMIGAGVKQLRARRTVQQAAAQPGTRSATA